MSWGLKLMLLFIRSPAECSLTDITAKQQNSLDKLEGTPRVRRFGISHLYTYEPDGGCTVLLTY